MSRQARAHERRAGSQCARQAKLARAAAARTATWRQVAAAQAPALGTASNRLHCDMLSHRPALCMQERYVRYNYSGTSASPCCNALCWTLSNCSPGRCTPCSHSACGQGLAQRHVGPPLARNTQARKWRHCDYGGMAARVCDAECSPTQVPEQRARSGAAGRDLEQQASQGCARQLCRSPQGHRVARPHGAGLLATTVRPTAARAATRCAARRRASKGSSLSVTIEGCWRRRREWLRLWRSPDHIVHALSPLLQHNKHIAQRLRTLSPPLSDSLSLALSHTLALALALSLARWQRQQQQQQQQQQQR